MGRNTDLQDELRRAEAHEKELQRRLGMQDGVSRPRNDNYNGGYSGGFNGGGSNGYNAGFNGNGADGYSSYSGPDGYGGYINYQSTNRQIGGMNIHTYKEFYRTSPNSTVASVAFKVLGIIFISTAILLLGLMWLVVDSMRFSYSRCTQQVQATVIRNEKGSQGTYSPVFEYEVDGTIYTQKSHNSSDPPMYRIGEQVTIHYDPTNPNGFYVQKEDTIVIVVMGSISGLFMLLGVTFIIVGSKKKRKAQDAQILSDLEKRFTK